jgi:hypothetical protein
VVSAQPPLLLQIGVDPTGWYLVGADPAALAAQLGQATGAITVQVSAPFAGTLVVSAKAAGSVRLGPPGAGSGTHPSDGRLPGSPGNLYVPRANGPSVGDPGFPLLPGTDLGALAQQIATAMTGGTLLTVPYGSLETGNGTVVLSGAALAYAVISPPKPSGPA